MSLVPRFLRLYNYAVLILGIWGFPYVSMDGQNSSTYSGNLGFCMDIVRCPTLFIKGVPNPNGLKKCPYNHPYFFHNYALHSVVINGCPSAQWTAKWSESGSGNGLRRSTIVRTFLFLSCGGILLLGCFLSAIPTCSCCTACCNSWIVCCCCQTFSSLMVRTDS